LLKNEPYFEARVGINTGPVVAGVVGNKKFAYDIWGDTVNLAARMEQNGEPNTINISESTYWKVKYDFDCEFRGKLSVKNKGDVEMYFVK
jgi:adenylate cyclase